MKIYVIYSLDEKEGSNAIVDIHSVLDIKYGAEFRLTQILKEEAARFKKDGQEFDIKQSASEFSLQFHGDVDVLTYRIAEIDLVGEKIWNL